jgi:hypothetical protein
VDWPGIEPPYGLTTAVSLEPSFNKPEMVVSWLSIFIKTNKAGAYFIFMNINTCKLAFVLTSYICLSFI